MAALHRVSFVFLAACASGAPAIPATPIAVAPPPTMEATVAAPKGPALPPPAPGKPITPAKIVLLKTKRPFESATAIVSPTLPIVYVRVLVRAGIKAGRSASLTADMLKEGGAGAWSGKALAEEIDAIGADLSVDVGLDRVVFGMAVTKDKLGRALDVLSAVLGKPRFDEKEWKNLKARELDRVRQAQKGSGGWMARQALYRTLLAGTSYAQPDLTEASLAKLELAEVKALYKQKYDAANMSVVVAGDLDEATITATLDAKFGAIPAGATPTPPSDGAAPTPKGIQVVLATKPGSKQADIFVARLAMPRKDARWADLALATHVLGGGMSMRLFSDVREKRSLAYSTSASTRELAWGGDSLVSLYAGTQTPLAPRSVEALLEHMRWIAKDKPITEEELAIARTSLESSFLYRLETIGAVAGLSLEHRLFGLPGKDVYDHVEQYRAALRGATLASARKIAADMLGPDGVIIAVAGDPALVGALSRFGPVTVLDPEKDFAKISEKAHDPAAELQVVP